MEIDIVIDKITNCLVLTTTGEEVKTYYIERKSIFSKKEFDGWKFDWSATQKNGFLVYELFVQGNTDVQGRISLKIEGGVANVDIVETAPHNYGRNGLCSGVGAHLFAIACKQSMENGCDGFVAFTAKSNLISYYEKTLGAIQLFGQRMAIEENAAKILIDKYFGR